jgi:hypothetical protein
MKKLLIREFSPLVLFIVSIILSILLTGIGLIHLVLKSILLTFQLRFWIGPTHFILYWLFVLYQIWNVIKFYCMQSAIAVDLLGNVTTGEAIEDCVTAEEKTMYGRGDITISTATGELEYKGKLNKLGIKFTKVLSKVLDENHCIVSYKRYLHNQSFKLE